MRRLAFGILIASTAMAAAALRQARTETADLETAFKTPSQSAKPHTWYHLMNGNVTKAGITRDFEALAQAGIGGVQMFDAGCAIPAGGLKFNTPEWFDLLRHAAAEARRLNLEICIPNCSGWSSSGGPWNTPTNGMKELTYRLKIVKGPQRFHAALEREPEDNGFYADIGVFAFPRPAAELAGFAEVRTTITDDTVEFVSNTPFEISGLTYTLNYGWCWDKAATIATEISEDGVNFKPFETFPAYLNCTSQYYPPERSQAFAHTVAIRALRAKIISSPIKTTFAAARPEIRALLNDLPSKTFRVRSNVTPDRTIAAPRQCIGRSMVKDVSANLAADGTFAWDVPEGEWVILRIGYRCNGRCNHPASDCGRGLEVDKLSAAAMDFHFEQYVARLCKALGPLAGNGDCGLNNILVDSFEVGMQNWTQQMETEFLRRAGYSLRPFMPVFAGYVIDGIETSERFLEDFRRVTADLFAENYAGALAKKCRQYGLQCSIEPYGNCPADNLQYGSFCDIPMGEFWSRASDPWRTDTGNALFASFVAHVWGKKYCATESFTAHPGAGTGRWLTTPFSIKAQSDSAYAKGVNRIIYHRFVHQPWADDKYLPGMTMGRWGMHFDRTQTWWEFVQPFLAYQTRCQELLQQGVFCADVLFFAGEAAPNDGGCNGAAGFFTVPPGYAFDICPSEAMYRLKVENGMVVAPGGVRYRLLAIPPMEACSPPMADCIAKLRARGANIAWPQPPKRSPGLKWGDQGDAHVRSVAAELQNHGVLACDAGTALEQLGIAPDVRTESSGDAEVKNIEWIHRRNAGADWYFTAMPNRRETVAELSFRQTGRLPELWDAETGTCEPAAEWREADGRTYVKVPYTISGSKFIVFRHDATAPAASKPVQSVELPPPVKVEGPWTVAFPHGFLPNALAKGEDETVTFERLHSWTEHENDGVRYFSGIATYTKTLPPVTIPAGARLQLDLGAVKEFAEVTVNGKKLAILWKPPYRTDITDAVEAGKAIELKIRVANLWANRLIGDDRLHGEDCEWEGSISEGVKEIAIKAIPQWVKEGRPSPTGRCTFTTWKHWDKNDELLPSGLLGEVLLRYAPAPARSVASSCMASSPRELFNGKDLSGWYTYLNGRGKNCDPKNVFSVKDGVIHITGEEWGSLITEEEFADYRLTVEYRFTGQKFPSKAKAALDSGILFHSVGADGGFAQTWMASHEYNLIQGASGDVWGVHPNNSGMSFTGEVADELQGGKHYIWKEGGRRVVFSGNQRLARSDIAPEWTDTPEAPLAWNEKPVGEWNVAVLECRGDVASYYFNGRLVNRIFDLKPARGRIQLQSEGCGIEFRRVTLDSLVDDRPNTAKNL